MQHCREKIGTIWYREKGRENIEKARTWTENNRELSQNIEFIKRREASSRLQREHAERIKQRTSYFLVDWMIGWLNGLWGDRIVWKITNIAATNTGIHQKNFKTKTMLILIPAFKKNFLSKMSMTKKKQSNFFFRCNHLILNTKLCKLKFPRKKVSLMENISIHHTLVKIRRQSDNGRFWMYKSKNGKRSSVEK